MNWKLNRVFDSIKKYFVNFVYEWINFLWFSTLIFSTLFELLKHISKEKKKYVYEINIKHASVQLFQPTQICLEVER